MKNPYEIIRRPIITEKTSKLVEQGQYTFEVKAGVNKVEVKAAVEAAFEVEVTSVKIINCIRKLRRVGKHEGLRPAVKKAIVTMKEGQTLDVFEI